ncbi:hypothetical protein FRC07_003643, partial [Ceratobasidium sp. 392]
PQENHSAQQPYNIASTLSTPPSTPTESPPHSPEDHAFVIPLGIIEQLRILKHFDLLPQAYPSPPPDYNLPFYTFHAPLHIPIMATTISDSTYKIPHLKGHENYTVWKIQMRDMYEEQNLWHYITNSQARPVITAGVTQYLLQQLQQQ